MATTLTEIATQAYALQARTTSAGAAADDVTGEDLRLVASLFSAGVVMSPTDAWQVRQRGAGANMSVDVGSGDADADIAVVPGTALGQGNYVVRREVATQNVTVPAAHVSSPRLDEVYLVVYDNAYDASGRVLPRLAYRDGTPAGSPVAPGPDAIWDAYLLLATVSVPAGDTAITDAQITDNRASAGVVSALLVPVPDHGTNHATAGTDDLGGGIAGYVKFGGASDTSSLAMTTSFQDGASVTFTKPSSWATYDIMAWGAVQGTLVSSAIRTFDAAIEIDGNTGSAFSSGQSGSAATDFQAGSAAAEHRRTGLSASAVVKIKFRESAADVTKMSSLINYIAVRVS